MINERKNSELGLLNLHKGFNFIVIITICNVETLLMDIGESSIVFYFKKNKSRDLLFLLLITFC